MVSNYAKGYVSILALQIATSCLYSLLGTEIVGMSVNYNTRDQS